MRPTERRAGRAAPLPTEAVPRPLERRLRQFGLLTSLLGFVTLTGYATTASSPQIVIFWAFCLLIGLLVVHRAGPVAVSVFLVVFGAACIGTVFLMWSNTAYYGAPYFIGGSDDLTYEIDAAAFAEQHSPLDYGAIRGGIVGTGHNSVGYVFLVGLLMEVAAPIGGFDTVMPRVLNALFLGLISVLILSIGHRLGLRGRNATLAALITGLFPLMVWVAGQTLRDIPVALLLVVLVAIWTPNHATGRYVHTAPIAIALSALALVTLTQLRLGQAALAAILLLYFIVRRWKDSKGLDRRVLELSLVPTVLLLGSGTIRFVSESLARASDYTASYAAYRLENRVSDGGLSAVVFEAPLFPAGWLLRAGYQLATPLPVSFEPAHNVLLSAGTIAGLTATPFLLRGTIHSLRISAWRPIGLTFSGLFMSIALTTLTTRQAVTWIPFAVLLVFLGSEVISKKPTHYVLPTFVVLAALAPVYLLLRA